VVNSTQKGAIAEQAVILEATRLGLEAMKPAVDGRRYDLVLDVGDVFLRAQVKWGVLREGVIRVNTRTSRLTPAGYVNTTYSAEEIDGFAVYCDETRECYWLPIEEFAGKTFAHLRVRRCRNNQQQLVNWAADYAFGAVAQLGERRAGSAKVRGSSPLSSIADNVKPLF
jgi:hypothetical protein